MKITNQNSHTHTHTHRGKKKKAAWQGHHNSFRQLLWARKFKNRLRTTEVLLRM